jgi:heme exporter protein A
MHDFDINEPAATLQARGLTYARNEEPVFGPLDFALMAGEIVLIEGDNGSGKTTLLKVLSGLLEPTSGEILLNGAPLTLAKLSHQVALLGHLAGLKLELSTLQNLRFAVGLGGIRAGITPQLALASVGLDGYDDQPVRMLSAGQRKRVALARLLLVPAALWLLDEPYANLDREGIELVNRLLDNHARRGGAALITSHGAYAYTSGAPRRISLAASSPSPPSQAMGERLGEGGTHE